MDYMETLYYPKRNVVHEILVPKSIVTWILKCINRPITGYEHKTNEKGEFMSEPEQLAETHYQLMVIASDYFRRGASEEKILSVLSQFEKDCKD